MKRIILKPFLMAALCASLAACVQPNPDDPDNPHSVVTWRDLGNEQIPILNADTRMAEAAASVQARWPTLREAEQDDDINWRDAHPSLGVFHGELSGFGVTMVRQDGTATIPAPEDIPFAEGPLDEPLLLFFDRRGGSFARNMPIIGMGYGLEFIDEDGDGEADIPVIVRGHSNTRIEWDPVEAFFFALDGTLIHEAGYHVVGRLRPGFRLATDDDLTTGARNRGLSIDAQGLSPVRHQDLEDDTGKHGRIWAMHVWFEPETGLPTIAPCDPFHRQRDGASSLPAGSFYYRKDNASRALVAAQCEDGGVYSTVAAQAPQ